MLRSVGLVPDSAGSRRKMYTAARHSENSQILDYPVLYHPNKERESTKLIRTQQFGYGDEKNFPLLYFLAQELDYQFEIPHED